MSATTLAGVSSAQEVIPGDLAGMRAVAERLRAQAWAYEDVATQIAGATRVADWDGQAAQSFHTTAARLPGVIMGVADAHARAAIVLDGHTEVVESARSRVSQAIETWQWAQRLTATARVDVDHAPQRNKPDILTGRAVDSRSFHDPGAPLRAEALTVVNAALTQVAESAQVAAGQIRAASDEAERAASIWDRIGGGWSDFWHGATDAGAGAINGIMSFGNALIQNPDILMEIIGGLVLATGGAAVGAGGLGATATGVGAPVGLAATAAAAAAILAGAGLAAHGIQRAHQEAAGNSAVAPLQGAARGGSGSPAALDAAQVEARAKAATRPGRNTGVRVVDDEDELRALFDELSTGGTDITPNTGAYANGGKRVRLPDGTEVGLRTTSNSGGPTIDITFQGSRRIKIHVG